MGVRSRVADGLTRAAKTVNGAPGEVMREAAREQSHMGPGHPFTPGEPLAPYDGYSRHPREFNFTTGYNIASRPRTHERVSFDTLKGLIDNYDVAQIAIWHRIDSIRSLDWKLVSAEHFDGDVSDAVTLGLAALKKPDRVHYFETWLGKWLWDVLAYDAGALFRLRNRAGRCIGLLPFDGTTVAPLLDYWGSPPEPPAQAYVQYVNGVPWSWLTRDDIVYEPYRMHNDSAYGRAPIESIMLNANTDIRFQLYFLQRFTDGNTPAAFASAPETWTPQQIEQFQEHWDTLMYGDQARKHAIRWIPGGSSFAWSDEKEFTDHFSLFLMRKTAAAFHVTPADLGFTESVNRSSGESQADVQHRVGDLPFIRYIQRILTGFLQDDLGLPLRFQYDLGEEQVDRVQQAQADKIYVDMGAISASHVAEMRFGQVDLVPVPRYVFTERGGPIPLAALMAVAGDIDPATAAPVPGAVLPHTVFGGVEGVLPVPPIRVTPLAEQQFGMGAMPPAPPPQPVMELPAPVVKETGPVGAAGITAGTGVFGFDGPGQDDDDDDDDEPTGVAKELAAFHRFEKARRKAGVWRDFEFKVTNPVTGHNLNNTGRLAVRKAAGQVAVAGLAVHASDTGRVLMLQRALVDTDPAAGKIEFPGGHIEEGETPLTAAMREWSEETGCVVPPGRETGSWTGATGVYRGFVWTVDSESLVPTRGDTVVLNPDDPDGDLTETIMWVNPMDLVGNPTVRPELTISLNDALAAITGQATGVVKTSGHVFKGRAGRHAACTRPGCGQLRTSPAHGATVTKAGGGSPKV